MMIRWGTPIAGRELKAVEVFMSHMQWWNELKSSGKIEEFKTFGTLTGNFGTNSGFVLIEGSQRQIGELMASEDYRVRLNTVIACVDQLECVMLESGDAMKSRMERYGKAVKQIVG
jgi:hypothetical protein